MAGMGSVRVLNKNRLGGEARTRERSLWEREKALKLQELKNSGALNQEQVRGRFGLSEQKLRNTGRLAEQTLSNTGRLDERKLANLGNMNTQSLANTGRLNVQTTSDKANLRKPVYKQDIIGYDIQGNKLYGASQNINTAAEQAKGVFAGVISEAQNDYFIPNRNKITQDNSSSYHQRSDGTWTNIKQKKKLATVSSVLPAALIKQPNNLLHIATEKQKKSFPLTTIRKRNPSTIPMTAKLASLENDPMPIVEAFQSAKVTDEELKKRVLQRRKRVGSLGRLRNPYKTY